MTEPQPAFDQVNIVVRDMDATLSFYRRLGLAVPDARSTRAER
jgi:catechol 2,3-dioxygenase-like lactoylglutathione lyase family enzyme